MKNSGHTRYEYFNIRLLSGKSVNIIEPFKRAFPEYFKVPVQQKDEFYDILSGYYEANWILNTAQSKIFTFQDKKFFLNH